MYSLWPYLCLYVCSWASYWMSFIFLLHWMNSWGYLIHFLKYLCIMSEFCVYLWISTSCSLHNEWKCLQSKFLGEWSLRTCIDYSYFNWNNFFKFFCFLQLESVPLCSTHSISNLSIVAFVHSLYLYTLSHHKLSLNWFRFKIDIGSTIHWEWKFTHCFKLVGGRKG